MKDIETDGCARCSIPPDRRAFLRAAGLSVAAALGSVAGAGTLGAEPLRFIAAIASTPSTHTYPVPTSDGAHIDKDNEVILVRWQAAVYAFNLACPHQNTALKWDDKAHEFQCPKHHSRYKPDGAFIDGRATRGMDRLAISPSPAGVIVDLDKMFKEDEKPAEWKAAVIHL